MIAYFVFQHGYVATRRREKKNRRRIGSTRQRKIIGRRRTPGCLEYEMPTYNSPKLFQLCEPKTSSGATEENPCPNRNSYTLTQDLNEFARKAERKHGLPLL